MKDKFTICGNVTSSGEGCNTCYKPCTLDIPDHIPDEQIQRYTEFIKKKEK